MENLFKFTFMAECKPKELVCAKTKDGTEWMIVGKRQGFYFPVVFLTGERAPRTAPLLNNSSDFYDRDFETYRVLNFGTGYEIVPDFAGECQVGKGSLFRTPGALMMLDDGPVLVVNGSNPDVWYAYLSTGDVKSGEPGGNLAAFKSWSLWIKHPLKPNEHQRLLSFGKGP